MKPLSLKSCLIIDAKLISDEFPELFPKRDQLQTQRIRIPQRRQTPIDRHASDALLQQTGVPHEKFPKHIEKKKTQSMRAPETALEPENIQEPKPAGTIDRGRLSLARQYELEDTIDKAFDVEDPLDPSEEELTKMEPTIIKKIQNAKRR